jgi:hypothetical protein
MVQRSWILNFDELFRPYKPFYLYYYDVSGSYLVNIVPIVYLLFSHINIGSENSKIGCNNSSFWQRRRCIRYRHFNTHVLS